MKDSKYFLIDMDGVLLDTEYDNYFWQKYIPKVYAQQNNISEKDSINITHTLFNFKRKSKDWYDVDYWSNILNINIPEEKKKKENMDRIKLIDGTINILSNLKKLNKELFLITNAHKKTLEIKMGKYNLKKFFSKLICSHELGYVKEEIQFWHLLRIKLNIDYDKTMLVEDTYDNICSAHHAGLRKFIYISDTPQEKNYIEVKRIKLFSELSSCL